MAGVFLACQPRGGRVAGGAFVSGGPMLDKLSQVQLRDLDLDTLQEEKGRTPEDLIATRERQQALELRLSAD